MSNRVVAGLLTAAAISLFSCEAPAGAATTGKAHKTTASTSHKSTRVVTRQRRSTRSNGRRVAGLIPPPPAYMPCVLPELYYRGTGSGITEISSAEEKKENPYSQYVKDTNGVSPEAMSSRKGVVTWNRRN